MVDAFAVTWAFAIGALSFFSPCSIAMLPAYLATFLGQGEAPAEPLRRRWDALALGLAGAALVLWALLDLAAVGSGRSRLGLQQLGAMLLGTVLLLAAGLRMAPGPAARGARLGALTSLGVLAVFVLIGLPLVGVLRVLDFQTQRYLVVAVALAMAGVGVLGLLGRDVGLALPVRAPGKRDAASFALFGAGYGIVAMGCNLPLFLAAALGPFLVGGDALTGLAALLAYAAGMGLLLVALSVSLAMGKGLTRERVRALVPKLKVLGNVVLILAGLYIVYYDVVCLDPGHPLYRAAACGAAPLLR